MTLKVDGRPARMPSAASIQAVNGAAVNSSDAGADSDTDSGAAGARNGCGPGEGLGSEPLEPEGEALPGPALSEPEPRI